MSRRLWMAFVFGIMTMPVTAFTDTDIDSDAEADQYVEVKDEILATERASREFMSKLYKINRRMKAISKKRDTLSNKMINTEANVKELAKTTAELEDIIKKQRSSLSKRIRTLYMLGEDKVLRALFSANNSEDLQQTLKYLKIFSEQDYHMVRSYESNLEILSEKRKRLERNVSRLIGIKKRLESEEKILMADQLSKSKFLNHLSKNKKSSLRKLSKLKKGLATDILDISFFEKKGRLPKPFDGFLSQDFGMIEDPKYRYRLSHKGHLYKAKTAKPVKAIADGRIVFSGKIAGYGSTAVIDHGDHYYSVYSGLKELELKSGDKVTQAQEISSITNELYFEIRHFSDAIDPANWVRR